MKTIKLMMILLLTSCFCSLPMVVLAKDYYKVDTKKAGIDARFKSFNPNANPWYTKQVTAVKFVNGKKIVTEEMVQMDAPPKRVAKGVIVGKPVKHDKQTYPNKSNNNNDTDDDTDSNGYIAAGASAVGTIVLNKVLKDEDTTVKETVYEYITRNWL